MVLAVSVCYGAFAQGTVRIGIATATTGGTFFPLGTGMAAVISEFSDNVKANAESTGGSVDNAKLVGRGDTELGLMMTDVAYNAAHGEGVFERAYPDLRGIMMGYGQMIHIVVKANSNIYSVEDLRGKRVSIGPIGSGTANLSEALFEAAGIWGDFTAAYLTHDEETLALGDGRIDAATYVIGLPAAAVTEFVASHPARFIPVTDELIAKVQETRPFFVSMPIPAGSYPGQNEAIPSVGVKVVLATNANVSDEVVYQVTKALLEHTDRLVDYHPTGADFNFENALSGMPIEVHEGALRYYLEHNHPDAKQ